MGVTVGLLSRLLEWCGVTCQCLQVNVVGNGSILLFFLFEQWYLSVVCILLIHPFAQWLVGVGAIQRESIGSENRTAIQSLNSKDHLLLFSDTCCSQSWGPLAAFCRVLWVHSLWRILLVHINVRCEKIVTLCDIIFDEVCVKIFLLNFDMYLNIYAAIWDKFSLAMWFWHYNSGPH